MEHFKSTTQHMTEQKKAEKVLKENEELFSALIKASSEMMYLMNPDWSEMHQLYGKGFIANTENLSRSWIQDYILPEDQSYVIAAINKAIKTKSIFELEHRVTKADGSIGWIFSRAVPIIGASGEIVEWFGMGSDITERKKAEEAVKHSETLYRVLAANLPNGAAFLFDKNLHFILAEGEAIRKAGFTSQDFEGKSIWNGAELESEQKEARELDLKQAFEGKPFIREHNAQGRHYVTHGVPIKKENGEIVSVLALSYDVTERKNAEEEVRQKEANQAFLLELGDHLRELNDPKEMMNATAEMLGRHLDVSRVGYAEIDDSEKTAMNYEWTDGTLPSAAGLYTLKDMHPEIVSTYLKSGVWRVDDIQTDPRPEIRNLIGAAYLANGVRSTVAYPLMRAGKWVALIFVHNVSPRIWKDREIELIKDVAERTWEAVKRGRAERALKKNQEQYRTLFNSISEGFACYKAVYNEYGELFDLLVLDINPAGAKLSGVEREAQIGKTWREVWNEVDNYWFEAYNRVDQTGKSSNYESFIQITGRWYTIQIDKIGKGLFASTFRDITERKEAEEVLKKAHENLEIKIKERTAELEEAYNSLLENQSRLNEAQRIAHIGNWDRNLLTGELYWSDEVYRIFGFKPQEFAVNYDLFLSYVHPEDKFHVRKAFKKALQENPFGIDYRIISAERKERTVHEEVEIIFNEKNTPVRMRGTVQDITERRNTEKFLAKLESARQKEIHHRIKNNLQVISSLLDLQAEKFSNRRHIESSEVLEAFRESQNRVLSVALIHEELHAGGELNKLNFSLYLQKLIKNLFQTYRLDSVNVSSSIRLQENVFFDMDVAVPLGIIVNELITNSLKYAFSGRKTGEVQIKFFSQEPKCENNKGESEEKAIEYTLIVADNGVGISKDLDSENSDALGLQLVKLLADQLDGKIELERDFGTRFTIRFNVIGR